MLCPGPQLLPLNFCQIRGPQILPTTPPSCCLASRPHTSLSPSDPVGPHSSLARRPGRPPPPAPALVLGSVVHPAPSRPTLGPELGAPLLAPLVFRCPGSWP